MTPRPSIAAIVVLAALPACGPPAATCPPTRSHVSPEIAFDSLPDHTFEPLLAPAPAERACLRPVRRAAPSCPADESVTTAYVPPEGAEPLVRASIDETHFVIWRPEVAYASGVAGGPVAIVKREEDRLRVRAFGTLRALPGDTRFSLERVASARILVVEGERCDAAGEGCVRATRLMVVDGPRIEDWPLVDARGDCLGSALFWHTDRRERHLDERTARTFAQTLTLAEGESTVTIEELVLVHDSDGDRPGSPPRLFRRAEGRRTLTPRDGAFVVEGESLWDSVLRDAGQVRGTATESPP